MTLLVGVLCQDGVVIGADSAATMGAMGIHTVRQSVTKVTIVNGRALIATSGPVGLGQRLAGEFAEILEQDKIPKGMRPHKAMQLIRGTFLPHIAAEMQAAQVAAPVVGPQIAQASAISDTLLAVCLDDGRPRLFRFDQQGSPEEATEDIPFVCLGSGEIIADPFMAFLRGLFWEQGSLPTLAEGQFATIWTLEQAIAVSPAFIAHPSRVWVLSTSGARCAARQVPEDELQDDLQAVTEARRVLGEWRRGKSMMPAPPPP